MMNLVERERERERAKKGYIQAIEKYSGGSANV